MKRSIVFVLAFLYCGFSANAQSKVSVSKESKKDFHDWAKTPPLGWNSWDIFGTAITEKQAREQADAMKKHLLPSGYDVFTVDIQWYQPTAKNHFYDADAIYSLSMDAYGRLTPAVNRFPSAADGKGFKPLADYVHSLGLRFGIHIMRGIPKQAVKENTPVLGTDVRAQDIALTNSVCSWNPDMYGVDATKPEGQAYYDSIIKLYASWGVDYIKCDDISRPYDAVQQAEIEALRKAIDKSGRKIVLSLSPGATPLSKGPHVMEHANLWRITDDFWDRWGLLFAMFERTHAWEPYRGPGHWPDADMLPIGFIDFGRPTKFTRDEHYTLMSLWSIARSPLIFGGDMTKLDDFTKNMLTNPEMLQVNQNSTNNRQVSRDKNLIVWAADVPGSKDKYVALFNAQSKGDNLDFANADYASPVIAGKWKSQEIKVSVKDGKRLVLFVKDGGNGIRFDRGVWVDPVLHGPNGDLKLTDLKWSYASAGYGETRVNRTCDNDPLMVEGKEVTGIGTHAESIIIYDLPKGYDTFTTRGVVSDNGSVVFGVLVDKGEQNTSDTSMVSVNLKDLGINGKVKVRDLWGHKDLGQYTKSFGQELPLHGAGMYRLTPVK
ncbi:NPCBM/NEW2 domain-containing protein [Botryobacter ruber]|uniref:NPCBM/NEW2 domain-containing protein n=1 Tax=Botryobacter ruber TaxID=2171629 RepID=UPI000E0A8C74|nr:NPCBM/NEW2 domain-containing protein [Botryobacter ruber]